MSAPTSPKAQAGEQTKASKDPEAGKRRMKAFNRLLVFCRPEAGRLTLGFTSLVVNSATNLSFPWLMGRSLDQINSDNYGSFLMGSAVLLGAGSLASWVRVYCLGTATDNISSRLRKQLFESYLDKDLEYFDSAKSGELISLLDEDVNVASEVFTEKLAGGVRSMNSALNGSVMLYLTSPRLCCVALSVVPVVGIGAMTLSRFSSALTKQLRSLQSEILSYSLERISNIATVKLNNREEFEKDKYGDYIQRSNALSSARYNARGSFMSFINLATNTSLLAVLREGGRLLAEGTMTAGGLARFAIQSAFVGLGFSGLATFYSDMVSALDAASRIFEIIDQNIEARSSRALLKASPESSSTAALVSKALDVSEMTIELEHVSFTYASRPGVPVLRDLSVVIPPHSFTCFAGKSGAGKSTLVAVLAGLLHPQEGTVRLGEQLVLGGDSRGAQWLHANVGVVQQHDKSLMSGTIRDNIEYGKAGASQVEIERAARAASAHEFIMALPNGYDSEVGVGGTLLSGGQRARIALARALVKDPACLLLDEPTASLDPQNENEVIAALSKLRASKTIIVVTHSAALMKVADVVHRMNEGAIEFSTPNN